ncbi:MAG: cupin domain-containing protein [Bacteroidales bacterium]
MKKINISHKLSLFSEYWSPKIIGSLNGQHVKLAKLQGEFIWHTHQHEDELFFILKGALTIFFRDHTVQLKEGEMIIIPKGTEHKPVAEQEVSVMIFEPESTLNTGDVKGSLTQEQLDWI